MVDIHGVTGSNPVPPTMISISSDSLESLNGLDNFDDFDGLDVERSIRASFRLYFCIVKAFAVCGAKHTGKKIEGRKRKCLKLPSHFPMDRRIIFPLV